MAETIKELLKGNVEWAGKTAKENPEFFKNLSAGQQPNFLWIGCADSRVPASEITGVMPGSIFVQRNIANVVIPTDSNLLSVVFYAVKVLKVKHIIVCGHYGCGGIIAAMSNKNFGYIDNWLINLKDVYRIHRKELDGISDEEKRVERFVELNVQEQVNNLTKISFIQEEWNTGEFPQIHGFVYSLKDGLLKDIGYSKNSNKHLDQVFQYS